MIPRYLEMARLVTRVGASGGPFDFGRGGNMSNSATVYSKGPGTGPKHLKHCIFDDHEWARLKADWLSYIETGKPVGGAYKYISNEAYANNAPGELLLRFDEIAAIT